MCLLTCCVSLLFQTHINSIQLGIEDEIIKKKTQCFPLLVHLNDFNIFIQQHKKKVMTFNMIKQFFEKKKTLKQIIETLGK